MIDAALAPRGALHPCDAPAALPCVALQCRRDAVGIVGLAFAQRISPAPRHPRSPCRRPARQTAASHARRRRAARSRPACHSPPSGTVNSAQRRQSSTALDQHPRGRRPSRRGERLLDLVGLARRAPARPVPGAGDDRHHVDLASARNRIGDEMRVRPHPELHAGRGIFARQRGGGERAAPGDQAGELRLHLRKQMVPHRRPDAVGADQRGGEVLLARQPLPLHHGQAARMLGDVLELAAEPKVDVGVVVDMRPAARPADRRDAPPNRVRRRGRWRPRQAAGGRSRRRRARS